MLNRLEFDFMTNKYIYIYRYITIKVKQEQVGTLFIDSRLFGFILLKCENMN